MITSKADIIRKLTNFCNTIHVETDIIVIGASSIILNYNLNRFTQDIDILSKIRLNMTNKYNIDIVNEGILFLCDDYRTRLIFHGRVGFVNIYALHGLDVALVKLGRGSQKDLDDIRLLLGTGAVNADLFVQKYPEFRRGYGGDYYIIDSNFKYITGVDYEQSNNRLF